MAKIHDIGPVLRLLNLIENKFAAALLRDPCARLRRGV
jgi:hypothetical protein